MSKPQAQTSRDAGRRFRKHNPALLCGTQRRLAFGLTLAALVLTIGPARAASPAHDLDAVWNRVMKPIRASPWVDAQAPIQCLEELTKGRQGPEICLAVKLAKASQETNLPMVGAPTVDPYYRCLSAPDLAILGKAGLVCADVSQGTEQGPAKKGERIEQKGKLNKKCASIPTEDHVVSTGRPDAALPMQCIDESTSPDSTNIKAKSKNS